MTTELKPPPMSDEQIGAIYNPWTDCAGASIADLMIATAAARDAQWQTCVAELQRDSTAALGLLARMRAACGDNGVRMQDELEQYLRAMAKSSARWNAMRTMLVAVDFQPEMGGGPVALFELHAGQVRAGPEGADEIADAAVAALSSEGKGAEG